MSYVIQVKQHWEQAIAVATKAGANSKQLECLRDLAKTEFGLASNMRLKPGCFWSTTVDRDGDVVLIFREPFNLKGKIVAGKRWVQIAIDHEALITSTDCTTKAVSVFNPYSDQRKFTGLRTPPAPLTWILDDRFLTPFVQESLKITEASGVRSCEVAGTRQIFSPFWTGNIAAKARGLVADTMYVNSYECFNGLMSGYVRRAGALHWFKECYRDEVSGERIYAVYQLNRVQKAVYHVNRVLDQAQFLCRSRLNYWTKLPHLRTGVQYGSVPFAFCAL